MAKQKTKNSKRAQKNVVCTAASTQGITFNINFKYNSNSFVTFQTFQTIPSFHALPALSYIKKINNIHVFSSTLTPTIVLKKRDD